MSYVPDSAWVSRRGAPLAMALAVSLAAGGILGGLLLFGEVASGIGVVTAVLLLIGFVFSLWLSIEWSIVIFILLIPFIHGWGRTPEGIGSIGVLAEMVFLGVLVLSCLVRSVVTERFLKPDPIVWPVLAFCAMLFVSALGSRWEGSLALAFEGLVPVCFFLLLASTLRRREQAQRVLLAPIALAFLGCAFSLLNIVRGGPLMALDAQYFYKILSAYGASMFGHASHFSLLLVVAMVGAVSIYLTRTGILKLAAGVLVLFFGIFLILCLERGAWLAGAAGLLFFAARVGYRRKFEFVVLVVGGVAVVLSFWGFIAYRIPSVGSLAADPSIIGRWQAWETGLRMMLDHPWHGVGLGMFSSYFAFYAPPEALFRPLGFVHAHSVILDIGAQMGVIGLLAFLTILGFFFKYCLDAMRLGKDEGTRALAFGLMALMFAFLIHANTTAVTFIVFQYHMITTPVIFWTLVAAAVCLRRALQAQGERGVA